MTALVFATMRGHAFAAATTAFIMLACAGPAAADCSLQNRGEWPLTMASRMATVPADINGVHARLFIDTGSFFSTLGPVSAERFKLKGAFEPLGLTIEGVTGDVRTHLARADDFSVGGGTYHNVQFLIGEHQFGPTDGLIGQNMLGNIDVEYDFANGVMRLFDAKGCAGASLAYWARDVPVRVMPIDPITPTSNQIHGTATLNGVRIRVVFDTGAAYSVVSLTAARRLGMRTDGPGVVPMGSSSGVGQRLTTTYLMPFASLTIADEQIRDTRLRVSDFDLRETDMLLGADFFLSHRIFVSRTLGKLYFTYNGGPVFDLGHGAEADSSAGPPPVAAAAPTASDDTPKDAAGFERRAAAFITREQFDKAIADYSSAIALEPNNAALYADRGLAYARNRQPILAMADFDQTIKLHPEAPRALLARGELRLVSRDVAGARADFAAALVIAPAAAAIVGDLYGRAGLYADAVAALDIALAGKPVTEDEAGVFLARCRARALGNLDLDQAVADCNTAMRLRPGGTSYQQLRGLAYLRQGKFDAAIADFNAALKLQPKDALSLYGRGLAEERRGDADDGAADITNATALDPRLADRLKAMGLAP